MFRLGDYTGIRRILWLGCSAVVLAGGSLTWGAVNRHGWPILDVQFNAPEETPSPSKAHRCCGSGGGEGLDLSAREGPTAPTQPDGSFRGRSGGLASGLASLLSDTSSEAGLNRAADPSPDDLLETVEAESVSATMDSGPSSFGAGRPPAMLSAPAARGIVDSAPSAARAKLLKVATGLLPLDPPAPGPLTAAAPVPEPAGWLTLIGGAFGLGALLRATRRRVAAI